MTIIEIPQQALVAGRHLGVGLLSRFFKALPFRESRVAGDTSLRRRKTRLRRNVGLNPARSTPDNAPLESLAGGALAARFHAWRGASGRRYVFSVFPANCDEPDAGLPDFADSIAIAAAIDRSGGRRLVALCRCESGSNLEIRAAFIGKALAAGAVEWHVHLLATEPELRRAVLSDIERAQPGYESATP